MNVDLQTYTVYSVCLKASVIRHWIFVARKFIVLKWQEGVLLRIHCTLLLLHWCTCEYAYLVCTYEKAFKETLTQTCLIVGFVKPFNAFKTYSAVSPFRRGMVFVFWRALSNTLSVLVSFQRTCFEHSELHLTNQDCCCCISSLPLVALQCDCGLLPKCPSSCSIWEVYTAPTQLEHHLILWCGVC